MTQDLAATVAESDESQFTCPNCGGAHFGRIIKQIRPVLIFGDVDCHDQFQIGCRWSGPWPKGKGGENIAAATNHALQQKLDALAAENERLKAIVDPLNEIRQDEGTTVSIICDNPDFGSGPDAQISVNADWTNWKDEHFPGKSLAECLKYAATVRKSRSRR